MNILEKSGAWYAFKGEKIGQGREKTKHYLEQNPEVSKEIEEEIRKKGSEQFGQYTPSQETTEDKQVIGDEVLEGPAA
jgi:hypothetical protein